MDRKERLTLRPSDRIRLLKYYLLHTHSATQTYTHRPHSDTRPQGEFADMLLKAPDRFSDTLFLRESIEVLGNLSDLCRIERGTF